ncbi:MAG: dihydropteroate synthase [Deltaproteobacteria bacterium]|nr:dihydropteroate synthase [Deltaproteobacteria bacterium]
MPQNELDIELRNGVLQLSEKTMVMGVINVTPDSFSDGNLFYSKDKAIAHGLQMVEDGVDIIDIGGESTRPFSNPVPIEEELDRVIPVVKALTARCQVPISIDTCKSEVARQALDAGAALINDISALLFDPAMGPLVASYGVPLVLMHMKGTPKTMQVSPDYDALIPEITKFLIEAMDRAMAYGIERRKIIIDPGLGFGKQVEHNLAILNKLSHFKILGRPILLGASRKAFIGKVLGLDVNQREEGTSATVAIGVYNGANIVRVHNVLNARRTVDMVEAIKRAGQL